MVDPATQHAATYAAILACLLLAVSRWRMDAVLGLTLSAAALALATGWGIGDATRRFSEGFGAGAAEQGLGILAASWVAQIAASCGAGPWFVESSRRFPFARIAPVVLGILAGPSLRPAVGLVLIKPIAAGLAPKRPRIATLQAALACSAAHGWLLPSPVMIAAATILGADWRLVLTIGLPGTILLAAFGAALQAALAAEMNEAAVPQLTRASAPAGIGLMLAVLAMLFLLAFSSLGDIPSEPFGGGHARDLVIGLGRPLALLVAGGAIMLTASAFHRGPRGRIDWHSAASLVLVLAAACGLQFVAQDLRMAEILAERAASEPWGLVAPFAAAALLKLTYGSSFNAAVAAAGIVQPLLGPLGLVTPWDHALAALAVGAGSVTGSTVTDGYFWLASGLCDLRPDRATLHLTLPNVLQGALALLILFALHLV